MTALTPAALSFLGDIGVRYGLEEARRLGVFMTDGTITHLDGDPVLLERDPRQLVLTGGEQMRLDMGGGTA